MSRWRLLAFRLADWVSTALIAVLSAVRAAFPTAPDPPIGVLKSLHADIIRWFVAIIAGLSLVALGSKIAAEVLSSQSKVRLKAILDVLRDSYFVEVPEEERHHNRVTLFRPDRPRKHLTPYCRSGTQYQRCRTSFAIDDNDEKANEGVAGRAWFSDATVILSELPDPCHPWDSAHADCIAYAEAGYLQPSKAAGLKIKSRSILATPVRDSAGARWGILVLDSRTPGTMTQDLKDHVLLVATAIGKFL